MKKIIRTASIVMLAGVALISCKKSNNTTAPASSAVTGFWTYKEDAANDYWNDNVLFKSDGTFSMYTALSLADTAAAQAIADTASQVVTFGTYTVKGTTVKMIFSEFTTVGLTFTGILNSSNTNIVGNLESSDPSSASPLWYLTKP